MSGGVRIWKKRVYQVKVIKGLQACIQVCM